jgi:hypothetical protein
MQSRENAGKTNRSAAKTPEQLRFSFACQQFGKCAFIKISPPFFCSLLLGSRGIG